MASQVVRVQAKGADKIMGDKDNQFTAPLRRPRAPTITLDTSAVNEHIGKSFTLWNLLLDDEALAAGVWLCSGTMTCGLLCKLQATGKSCYLEEEASLSDLRCQAAEALLRCLRDMRGLG